MEDRYSLTRSIRKTLQDRMQPSFIVIRVKGMITMSISAIVGHAVSLLIVVMIGLVFKDIIFVNNAVVGLKTQ